MRYVVLAIPFGMVWMLLTSRFTPDAFLLGFALSWGLLFALGGKGTRGHNLPARVFALTVYTLTLFRDIWLSAIDVARRILSPTLGLKPGIIAVETQDTRADIAALSAHSITITPGELVLEFDDNRVMYVHCLDVEASQRVAVAAQTRRLGLLRRILNGETGAQS